MDERTTYDVSARTLPQPPSPPPVSRERRPRLWLVSALIGAVVGAAVSGGIVALVKDDGGTTAGGPSRPSAVITAPGDIGSILAKVEPAVVSISTRGFAQDDFANLVPREGTGTGVVLTPDGDVLTNAHVIADATAIKVKPATGERTYDATLLGSDPAADVALIHLRGASNLPVATLGRSADVQVGDQVVAIGNQLGLSSSATAGVVSGLNRIAAGADGTRLAGLIQFDAAVNAGSSGGPLVNVKGETVGIVVALANPTAAGTFIGVGFAVPIGAAAAPGGQGPEQ